MPKSAVVIEVPEVEPVVSHWRRELDPSAAVGVPAHITLLYPFVATEQLDERVFAALRSAVASTAAFDFSLAEVCWFGEEVVYLRPHPSDPFRELIDRLCRVFPECPPYGGAHQDVVAHLTVGDRAPLDRLQAASGVINGRLPIDANAHNATLLSEQADGQWTRAARFRLG